MNLKAFFSKHWLPLLICLFAVFGFTASLTLSVDKLELLKNPNQTLNCNVNVFLNCASVMKRPEANFYDIPWSFFGVAGYPATFLIGLLFIEKRKMSAWLSSIISAGAFFAFALSTYFMWISGYIINVFCPWCILSAISSTGIFFSILIVHFQEKNLPLPEKWADYLQRKTKGGWYIPVVLAWYILLIFAVTLPFWW